MNSIGDGGSACLPEVLVKECILDCYYDKELGACGSCERTLEEIKEAGLKKKENNGHRS